MQDDKKPAEPVSPTHANPSAPSAPQREPLAPNADRVTDRETVREPKVSDR
jgi:hypothetical protein